MAMEVGFVIGGALTKLGLGSALPVVIGGGLLVDKGINIAKNAVQINHVIFQEQYARKILALKLSENYTQNLAAVNDAYMGDIESIKQGDNILNELLHGALNSQKMNNFK